MNVSASVEMLKESFPKIPEILWIYFGILAILLAIPLFVYLLGRALDK